MLRIRSRPCPKRVPSPTGVQRKGRELSQGAQSLAETLPRQRCSGLPQEATIGGVGEAGVSHPRGRPFHCPWTLSLSIPSPSPQFLAAAQGPSTEDLTSEGSCRGDYSGREEQVLLEKSARCRPVPPPGGSANPGTWPLASGASPLESLFQSDFKNNSEHTPLIPGLPATLPNPSASIKRCPFRGPTHHSTRDHSQLFVPLLNVRSLGYSRPLAPLE